MDIKTRLNELDGWQRLWIIASSFWLLLAIVKFYEDFPSACYAYEFGSGRKFDLGCSVSNFLGSALYYLVFAATVPTLLYASGLIIKWVAGGFKASRTE